MGPRRLPVRPRVGSTSRPRSHPGAPEVPCRLPRATPTREFGLLPLPVRPTAVPGMVPRAQSQSAPMCRLPSTWSPESIISENLFRGADVDHRKSADPGAEGIHSRSIEGPAGLLELFFQRGNYRIAEIQTHTFADLLSQTMGNGILDIQRALFLPHRFSGPHDLHCKAIPRYIPEPGWVGCAAPKWMTAAPGRRRRWRANQIGGRPSTQFGSISGRISTNTNVERFSQDRVVARNSGHADSALLAVWSCPWASDSETHPAHHRGRAAGRARLTLSGAAPPGTSRLDRREVGAGREGPETRVQILSPHTGREKTTPGGRVQMEANDGCDRTHHVARSGGVKCTGGNGKTVSGIWSANCVRIWNWKPPSRRRMTSPRRRLATPHSEPLAGIRQFD